MADVPKKEDKKPIDEILEKYNKKHKSFDNWIKTLELRHASVYSETMKELLAPDKDSPPGPYRWDLLEKPEYHKKVASKMMEKYRAAFEKENGWSMKDKDDAVKAQVELYMSGMTEGTLAQNIARYKSNYTPKVHNELTRKHVDQLRELQREKSTDHIGEEHIDDILEHMKIKGKVDKNLLKNNIYEVRHVFSEYMGGVTNIAEEFAKEYPKREEKKPA